MSEATATDKKKINVRPKPKVEVAKDPLDQPDHSGDLVESQSDEAPEVSEDEAKSSEAPEEVELKPEPEKPTSFPLPLLRPTQLTHTHNFLFHGDPGAGKTWLLGTADEVPEMCPVLIIDTEGGTLTIRDRNVDVVRVSSYEDIQKVVLFLRRDAGKTYRTVGVDSLTELQKLIMAEIVRAEYQLKPDRHDPDIPEQRDWGKNSERVRKIVRAIRDLPVNAIFTTLSKEVGDEGSSIREVKPALPGQLANEIPGFIDVVGYLQVARVNEQGVDGDGKTIRSKVLVRRLIFEADRITAKDRSQVLAARGPMEDPSMKKIYTLFEEAS